MTLKALILGAALAAPGFSALQAQDAVLRTLLDRGDPAAPPATLWIVDAKGSQALADGFAALLQAPGLWAYGVPQTRAALDGAGGAVLAQHGLAASPQWFLLDARADAVLARGSTVPTREAFAQILEQAGFRDRAKELQAYLKGHPESLEAHEQLLRLLRTRSESMALRFMGVHVASPRQLLERNDLAGAFGPQPRPDLSAAKALGPVQDLEAWSAFTQELDADFSSGRWREMDMAWIGEGRRLDAASPTLQGLYFRWMPEVEAALRQQPSSDGLWALWGWMSEATGGRRLAALMASLRPSPLTPRSEWPPETAARMLLASAKTPEDWDALKAHYEAVWEDGFHPLLQRSVEMTSLPWETDWDHCLGPLVECCLRAGGRERADALVRNAFDASRWASLPAKASALAARCGDRTLAARWAALGAAK